MLEFQIMPFRFLPAHIRWAYARYANQEYAGKKEYTDDEAVFLTVDDVDNDDVGIFWYGALLTDGRWLVDESHTLILEGLENMIEV